MRLLLLAMAALCLANPAWAELRVDSHVGVWDVFSGTGTDGRQTCGIGHTNTTDGAAFSLRYAVGADGVTFVAAKPHWTIPDGTHVPVVMQIGLNQPWTEQATGHGNQLQWTVDPANMQVFDTQFRRANSMTVTFPAGSEPPWVISLNGSMAASNAMGRCITAMTQNAAPPPSAPQGPTQPFGTSPAAPAPSAPAPSAQPVAPTQPTQLTPPAQTH